MPEEESSAQKEPDLFEELANFPFPVTDGKIIAALQTEYQSQSGKGDEQ